MECNNCKKEFDPVENIILYGATLAMYVNGELKQICFQCSHVIGIPNEESSIKPTTTE